MPERDSNIGRRMAKGAAWMVLMRFSIRGIGLISTVVLARLLTPADFGLVALGTALLAGLDMMSEFSFDMALIRDQTSGRSLYNAAWTLNVIKGVGIATLLVVGADWAADFFQESRLQNILFALAAVSLLRGLQNIGVVEFRKELTFAKEYRFFVVPRIVGFVVTIFLAVIWRDYWALVGGIIVSAVAQLSTSYWIHPYRPNIGLRGTRELFRFSVWLLFNNILVFLNQKLDTFVVGRLIGIKALGLYQVSHEIADLASSELVMPIMRAIYPGYAKVAHDRAALAKGYLDVFGVVVLCGWPIATGIAVTADLVVRTFLGDQWIDVIPVIAVLGLYGATHVASTNTGSIFLAVGRPQIIVYLLTSSLMIRIPLLYYGAVTGGIIGVAWAMIGVGLFMLVANHTMALRNVDATVGNLIQRAWRPLIASIIMALSVHGLLDSWAPPVAVGESIAKLLASALLGSGVYVTAVLLLWRLSGLPDGAEAQVLKLIRPFMNRVTSFERR